MIYYEPIIGREIIEDESKKTIKLEVEISDQLYNDLMKTHSDQDIEKGILYSLVGIIRTGKVINKDNKLYCDRNLCFSMDVNGKGCEDCPVTKQDNQKCEDKERNGE